MSRRAAKGIFWRVCEKYRRQPLLFVRHRHAKGFGKAGRRVEPDLRLRVSEVKSMLTEALPKLRSYAADVGSSSVHSSGRVHSWVRETLCALRGHDLMLHFERGRRICLRCVTCGHETPGWHTK